MPFVVVSCVEQKPEETPIQQNDENEQKKVEGENAQEETKELEEKDNKENDAKKKADQQTETKAAAEKTDDQSKDKGVKQAENKIPIPSVPSSSSTTSSITD